MRILHVVPLTEDQLDGDGRAAVALNHCLELRRRGHEAQLLAWCPEGDTPSPHDLDGLPVHLIGRPGPWRRWLARHLTTFDLVHVHLDRDRALLRAAIAAQRTGVPYVVQTHGGLTDGVGRERELAAVRQASLCLAQDGDERDTLTRLAHRADGSGAPPIRLLGTGVPTSDIQAAHRDPLDLDGIVRVRDGDPVLDVLCVGGAGSVDIPLLTETARLALGRGLNARFTLAGPIGRTDPAWERFVAGHPELAGRVGEESTAGHGGLRRRLAEADLVVSLTRPDARSMTLVEALAAGSATVCTADQPHAAMLRSRHAARVTTRDAESLADAVCQLALDPRQRADLAHHGRVVAALLFDIGRVVDDLEDGYAQALLSRYPLNDADDDLARQLAARAWREHTARERRDGAVIDLDAAPAAETPSGEPAPDRQWEDTVLWVSTEVNSARLALWRRTALRTDLTVALLAPSPSNLTLSLLSSSEPFHLVQLDPGGRENRWGANRSIPLKTLRTLIRYRPDAIVLDGEPGRAFTAAARWAAREGIPLVVHYPAGRDGGPAGGSVGGSVGRRRRGAWRRLIRRSDAVLAAGSPAAREVMTWGVAADRITVVPGPAESSLPEREQDAQTVDVRLGHRFLYMRPLLAGNNPEGLLRAFRLARGMDDVLMIAGNGPMYPHLVDLADRMGLREHVVFTEAPVDEVERGRLLASVHTVILPSLDLPWTTEATEALAAGRHVVASRDPAAPSGMTARAGLFLVEPTAAQLSRAMMRSRQRWSLVHEAGMDPALVDRGMAAVDHSAHTIATV